MILANRPNSHGVNVRGVMANVGAGLKSQQRGLETFRMIDEVKPVAALDAQELPVDAAAVAVVAADYLVVADAQCRPAAVGAMRANRADVVHLPGSRLVAVDAAGERADRA